MSIFHPVRFFTPLVGLTRRGAKAGRGATVQAKTSHAKNRGAELIVAFQGLPRIEPRLFQSLEFSRSCREGCCSVIDQFERIWALLIDKNKHRSMHNMRAKQQQQHRYWMPKLFEA
jgi:hypothetical protein